MTSFVAQLPYAVLIVSGVLLGLHLANEFYDIAPTKQWITRKVGHLSGFVGYLLCAYMLSSFIWPLVLSVGFLLLLSVARLLKGATTFRGVARTSTWAEIWYPISAGIVVGVMWGIYDKPFLAVFCIGLLGVSDAVTGIVRSKFCKTAQKHWSGSVAMFLSSLLLAGVFVHPFWIGVIASVFGTLTEWASGDVSKVKLLRKVDDNISVPLIGMIVVILLTSLG